MGHCAKTEEMPEDIGTSILTPPTTVNSTRISPKGGYTIRPAWNLRTSDAPWLTITVTNHRGDVQTTYQTGR